MEAGVAKGTLYVYFKDREEILDAALVASFDPLIRELSALLDDDRASDRKLAGFSLCHLRVFDEHRDLVRVLFYDRERMHSEKNHYTDIRYRTFVDRVADEQVREAVQDTIYETIKAYFQVSLVRQHYVMSPWRMRGSPRPT